MITFIIILTTCLLNVQIAFEQMLGKTKKEIQAMMNNHSEYSMNNFGISTNDNTLRYYNAKKDNTLIFYFDKAQKCKHIKFMDDIDNLTSKSQELNQKYNKTGKKWTCKTNNANVIIEIEQEEYNYSLNYHY
ncbi:MAG: hypothetical protein HPY79_08515 [Bacteroidales bacterium]|nr:hypothetical protein [Bacteroidales bacterium]